MSHARLTSGEYWESGYAAQPGSEPLRLDDFRHLADRRIVERIETLGLTGMRVLELGAGNSAVLSCLARAHPDAEFSGLDYSESGCRMLARRAEREGARIAVFQQDLFAPEPFLVGSFDRVYSLGVVEHFADLAEVLVAQKRFLSDRGRMLTVIPNMAGVLGRLTRRYNPAVFALHVPHDLRSLRDGHLAAGLEIEASGYLCSTNFGVIASCFSGPADRGWTTYLWLSRLSTLLWWVEARVGDLPHSATFSPYLYVVSRPGS